MNIKIVYNTKTHKISTTHKTLETIKNAIQNLYPKHLEKGFDLYVTLHPQMEPFKIQDQEALLRIQQIYTQMNWTSIKFLVKDSTNPNLTNDDLSLLNQSVITQSNVQLSTVMNFLQESKQQNQEQFTDQKQQIVIEENKPETNLAQEIIKQIEKQEFLGFDYHSEEFKQFIIQRIDNRLKYHGILQPKNSQAQQYPQYKMELKQQDFIITKKANEKFEWNFEVFNTGNQVWRRNQVAFVGLNGLFKNVKIQLTNDVYPGQTAKFSLLYQMPKKEVQNLKHEFQLTYQDEQNQTKFFGKKISLVITVKKDLQQIKDEKILQLMESVQISFEQATEFLEMYGSEDNINDIVFAYLGQPK
ncbi:unnamed protein product (macronuclear) [Paramecium tetraurelia]|uniref:Next to BRCA1 central domain-containing protein n=1 Tax=Paramecium tetraurelia TaxID=5888 RepID=A0C7E1_PARTE|nr:uncharacterized protein GSPATT00035838001 [Paramecium tetraurelia]CAK66708.1 unnamed protein product [Paramecium tetraurelia]|eukprot:XP_001434105.1 hypothetical protein (macronuclear) [Paramecium tetraurelia strain d4-2]